MSAIAEIFRPGTAAAQAARPIATRNNEQGKHPYQWLYPGPFSKPAFPSGVVPVPAIVSPATSATAVVLQYEVSTGYVFVLQEVLMNTNAQAYTPGQQQLLFTLQALYASGPRNVDFLANLDFTLGEFTVLPGNNKMVPYQLKRPIVFNPLDVLQISAVNNGITTPASTDVLIGILGGYLFPESECR